MPLNLKPLGLSSAFNPPLFLSKKFPHFSFSFPLLFLLFQLLFFPLSPLFRSNLFSFLFLTKLCSLIFPSIPQNLKRLRLRHFQSCEGVIWIFISTFQKAFLSRSSVWANKFLILNKNLWVSVFLLLFACVSVMSVDLWLSVRAFSSVGLFARVSLVVWMFLVSPFVWLSGSFLLLNCTPVSFPPKGIFCSFISLLILPQYIEDVAYAEITRNRTSWLQIIQIQ